MIFENTVRSQQWLVLADQDSIATHIYGMLLFRTVN